MWINGPFLVLSYCSNLKPTEKPRSGKKEQVQPKPSRSVKAREVVEEYIKDLRAIIRKWRRHLN
jgi:hypothetical protein